MTCHRIALLSGLVLFALSAVTSAQVAGVRPLPIPIQTNSGTLTNQAKDTQTLFHHLVTVPEASSLQIRFGRTKLPNGCFLRMTSLADGAVQHHRAETLRQWQGASAWFNGHSVLVELVAGPGTSPTHVNIDEARILRADPSERSICGSYDDRVLSEDPRCGRVFPIGCTGWIIDDPNHTFITAGHCAEDDGDIEVMQFNVPLSDETGNWQHPGPEDQYPLDPESLQMNYVTLGEDWAYFGCFPNTETGLTPYEAQGAFYELADNAPALDNRTITITGYGSVSSPVDPSWNLVQKTHSGPYAYSEGAIIGYTTDTSGGNSGSAVLDEKTGLAIGIHTNGGCESEGHNFGCAIQNAGLQNALDNPLGVCRPNIVVFDFPDGRPESVLPETQLEMRFTVMAVDENPLPDTIAVIMGIDGDDQELSVTALGNDLYKVVIPALECEQDVDFYIEAQGDAGGMAYHPFGAPDDRHGLVVGTITSEVILDVSFESGIPSDWSATGLWHASDTACAPGPSCDGYGVVYYGVDSSCTFNSGSTNAGALSSPAMPMVIDGGPLELTYCSTLQTEDDSGWDIVQVLVNGVVVDEVDESPDWEERSVMIDSISGDTVVVSFAFDTVDNILNDYTGWHIDNVRLIAPDIDCDPDTPCPGDADGSGAVEANDILLVIANWGNPGGPGDVNNDGNVDANDILLVIGYWGPC